MSLEHIRISSQAKEQLVRLKRYTGIKHWNVLCRWAFCASLAEPGAPAAARIATDSSVEMTWRIFGGPYADILMAALKQRCHFDGLTPDDETLAEQFKLHLHRGIGYLAGEQLRRVDQLVDKAMSAASV